MDIFGGHYSTDHIWELRFHSKSSRTQWVSSREVKPAESADDKSRRLMLDSRDKKTRYGQKILK